MRKLKLQVVTSVDGFIAGPNGEMDWVTHDWDDDLKSYVEGLTASVDCIVLGRRLAEGFIPHWAAVAADPEHPERESGRLFTDLPKVVFTHTLETSPWPNTALATGDLAEAILRLKKETGGDLIAYGGGTFVSSLTQRGLIDEFHLLVNPVALGSGMAIFPERARLRLEAARAFPCGVALLRYGRA
ncbi:dihydrofolate reductase family protein [Truepera radiovictrix]|uniref:Bifunctional deaminase-reductase domain protein n=1 Tax=Truepera radiovictrix (strain DSM 17093 / CIP 108686 / LMG 22925 / RQ-24) TaxID=649638 RepID=D7CUV1_TRURR|nr:dihydrofolate reductase family protein [Truepera radiovictrix]ADI14092.1 bifunctional deaminase-reductase domain protein [Truepera radiovictrix DSM 17093]WMT57346.1 dihydrofolate reductase family protein [Truepera radiovictrix]